MEWYEFQAIMTIVQLICVLVGGMIVLMLYRDFPWRKTDPREKRENAE